MRRRVAIEINTGAVLAIVALALFSITALRYGLDRLGIEAAAHGYGIAFVLVIYPLYRTIRNGVYRRIEQVHAEDNGPELDLPTMRKRATSFAYWHAAFYGDDNLQSFRTALTMGVHIGLSDPVAGQAFIDGIFQSGAPGSEKGYRTMIGMARYISHGERFPIPLTEDGE